MIDPKGDITNLLLTFPELRSQDFVPWINEEEALKKGLSTQEYASQQADLWKNGLLKWGRDGKRIQRLRDSAARALCACRAQTLFNKNALARTNPKGIIVYVDTLGPVSI